MGLGSTSHLGSCLLVDPNQTVGDDKMSSKLCCLIGLVTLALCMVTACAQDSSLRVIGIGTVQVPADTAIIAISAENYSDNVTVAEAMASKLLNSTEEALINAGVKKEEIMPDRFKRHMTYHKLVCNTVNNNTTCKEVVTKAAAEQIIIKTKISDANQTQKLIDVANAAGAKASVLGYTLNDPSTAVDQARKKALDDAKAKAENYASSLGFSLGKAMEIEEPSYPDIEIGPTYEWGMPWRMNDRFWGISRINRLFRDDYIPEGMAKVTAFVSVTYKAVSA